VLIASARYLAAAPELSPVRRLSLRVANWCEALLLNASVVVVPMHRASQ
jgi:hypothetical protein